MGRSERKRNRASGRSSGWSDHRPKSERMRYIKPESPAEIAMRENAIREFKARENICPACGKRIEDMAEAIADKSTGKAMHFDCVLEQLRRSENPSEHQQVTYIGQGRFALVNFLSRDGKKFKIEKIIEWEDKNSTLDWRSEMAALYSKVR